MRPRVRPRRPDLRVRMCIIFVPMPSMYAFTPAPELMLGLIRASALSCPRAAAPSRFFMRSSTCMCIFADQDVGRIGEEVMLVPPHAPHDDPRAGASVAPVREVIKLGQ